MFYSTKFSSPIGNLTLVSDGKNLNGLWIEGQKYYGGAVPETMTVNNDVPVFTAAKQWLDKYFAGKKPALLGLPLAPIGSEFRQSVWSILREIPYGKVVSYGGIARQMAGKLKREMMSSQAVGGAVGHNPISIIIPCHRVVGADGSLTGYAGGIQTKIKLLELEGLDMAQFYIPAKGTAL